MQACVRETTCGRPRHAISNRTSPGAGLEAVVQRPGGQLRAEASQQRASRTCIGAPLPLGVFGNWSTNSTERDRHALISAPSPIRRDLCPTPPKMRPRA